MSVKGNTRSWVWGIVALAVFAVVGYRTFVFSSSRPAGTPQLMFVTGGADPYWQLTVRGAKDAAAEYTAQLTVVMPAKDESLAEQTQILSGVNADEVDGVAVSPLDANAQTRLLNRLAEKLNVVTFDSDAPLSNRQFFVGTSNFYAGQLCAQLVKETAPAGGKVAVFAANLTKHNMTERKLGFDESLHASDDTDSSAGSPTYEILPYLIDNGDAQKCLQNLQQTLEANEDIVCLVGLNGYHGPVLLDAVKSAEGAANLQMVVFDEAEETLDGIDHGRIYATVAQDPYKYGYEAVRMLAALHRGKARELPIVGGGQTTVRCEAIRRENLDQFRERLRSRLNAEKQDAPSQDAAL